MTVGRGATSGGVAKRQLAFAAEQAFDRFHDFVNSFSDRRFRAGDAADDFFGGFGDPGIPERPAKRLIDTGDRVVDSAGYSPRGRLPGGAATRPAAAFTPIFSARTA